MENRQTIERQETISAQISTTTTTTTVIEQQIENAPVAIAGRMVSKETATTNSGQRPKILMYESTLTAKVDDATDLLTDDDTNSVGSSIDSEFIQTIDKNNESTTKNTEQVGIQLESLSISATYTDQRTTQDKSVDDMMNLSHRLSGMDLLGQADTVVKSMKTESQAELDETNRNCSAVTLSSTESEVENEEPETKASDGRKSSIIVLSDSDDESSAQPPLKTVPRSTADYLVSSDPPSDAVVNLPSSSVMHKIDEFFDNVPSLNTSLIENEPVEEIHVSESTCNDDPSENTSNSIEEPSIGNKSVTHDDANRSSPSIVPATCDDASSEEDEFVGVTEVRNVPVAKSSSDQVHPVSCMLSGIKVKTTNSTPIIESAIHNADGVRRTDSNGLSAAVKSTGSTIKFNTDSNGHLNIAAKININIQISNASTSEDSSPETSQKDEASLDTPAIESETIPETANTKKSSAEDASDSESVTSLPATQVKSIASSPEQQKPHRRHFQAPSIHVSVRDTNSPRTPAINRLKSFEFSAPKSMTKLSAAENSSYVTPRRKLAAQPNKENELPDEMPNGFRIDKSINVDPKDQLLLHQVYGEAWKTPEVLRSYSAIKGRPIANEPKRGAQSAQVPHQSRFSCGFNLCKYFLSHFNTVLNNRNSTLIFHSQTKYRRRLGLDAMG